MQLNWVAQQFEKRGHKNPAHHLYMNHFLATTMRQTRRAKKALEYIEAAQSYWEPLKSTLLEEELLLEQGLIYLKLGDEEKGLAHCTRAIDMVSHTNNKSIAQVAHEELAAYFKRNKRYEVANDHLESAHQIERNELSEAKVVAIESLEAKYEILSELKNAEIHRLKNIELFAKNEELVVLNQELEKLLEQRSEMMKIAVHDLRTPITTIQLQIFLLAHHKSRFSSEKRQSIIRSIQEASHRLTELLDQWLSSEQIEQRDFEIVWAPLNPFTVLESVVDHIGEFAFAKSISIINLSKRTTDSILTDEIYLRQILLNLISNALKYSLSNSVIYVDWYEEDESFIFEIRDEGEGFSKQELPKLFKKTPELSVKPDGLGLHIAQKLSQVIGGEIEATSEGKNLGSTFRVILPKVTQSHSNSAVLSQN